MTANVRIISEEKDVPVSVAAAAVKWEAGSQLVYKVINREKNETEKVHVRVGARGEDRVEILDGVKDGDVVVVRFSQGANSAAAPMGGGGSR